VLRIVQTRCASRSVISFSELFPFLCAQDAKQQASHVPPDDSPCNLIVKYLPDSVQSEDGLRELFEPFGPVVSAKLIIDKLTGSVALFSTLITSAHLICCAPSSTMVDVALSIFLMQVAAKATVSLSSQPRTLRLLLWRR